MQEPAGVCFSCIYYSKHSSRVATFRAAECVNTAYLISQCKKMDPTLPLELDLELHYFFPTVWTNLSWKASAQKPATPLVERLGPTNRPIGFVGFSAAPRSLGSFLNMRHVRTKWSKAIKMTRSVLQQFASEAWVSLSINSTKSCQNVLERNNEPPTCSHTVRLFG